MSNKVARLKAALLDELITQLTDGPVVVDKETGEALRVSPGAPLMAVAVQVVKAFASEAEDEGVKAAGVSSLLRKYADKSIVAN